MSMNWADNIDCWSLMEFGCDIVYTLEPRILIYNFCCSHFWIRTHISMYMYFDNVNDQQFSVLK